MRTWSLVIESVAGTRVRLPGYVQLYDLSSSTTAIHQLCNWGHAIYLTFEPQFFLSINWDNSNSYFVVH